MVIKDIEGTELSIGDEVYYARKNPLQANGYLVDCIITDIQGGSVYMNKYISTSPSTQLVKKTK